METKKYYWEQIGVSAELSLFIAEPAESNDTCDEMHVMLHIEPRGELFDGQVSRAYQAEKLLIGLPELQGARAIFKRYFLSDATNQMPVLEARRHSKGFADPIYADDIAVSAIQQPPLDGSKIAIWIYFQRGSKLTNVHDVIVAEHNGYRHLYKWGLCVPSGDSYYQTRTLLEDYEHDLSRFDARPTTESIAGLPAKPATIASNCIRTWFFVRDVDTQYAGLVKARKENFEEQGLNEHTHYIASTGIGGNPANPRAIVQLGTYALTGFDPKQQYYLYAKTHLNPTIEYGVTFERGTVVEFGDRAQVYISGTASINNKGEVMHIGDIVRQTERMWENVSELLKEGNASFDDVMQIIVYLRDLCDYPIVKEMFDRRFPDIPRVITLAPVCRPTWLIEMECIATPRRKNPEYRDF